MTEEAVVSICDRSGVMVRPWAEAGHRCVCYDLKHPIRADRTEKVGAGSITYRWADARSLTLEEIGPRLVLFFFPPCTHLSVSGARDIERKGLRPLIDALEIVESCRVLAMNAGVPWMIENPVSRLAKLWRKPDHYFDPCDYGDGWKKKTSLWVGGGFVMPEKHRVPVTEPDKIWKMSPGPDRADARSETPPGFARAVFEANSPLTAARRAA